MPLPELRGDPVSEERILAELERLRAEVGELRRTRAVPSHYRFLSRFIKDFETNPHVQYKVHRIGMWFWTINFPLIALLYIFLPRVWAATGIFITLEYSIYANWTTDAGSMSAAMAAYEMFDRAEEAKE